MRASGSLRRSASEPARRNAPVVAAVALVCAVATPAAARSLAIASVDVQVAVARDASIDVTEVIHARFTGAWNGIYRTIPVVYRTARGFGYRLVLDPIAVTDADGRALRWEAQTDRHYRKFKFWIPDARDAARTVVFRYRVRNALRFFEDHDELYWNVTGDEWDVPIERATARISLPAGATGIRAAAFTGAYGSRAMDADVETVDDGVVIRMGRSLGFHEGLTAVVGWDKGAVEPPGPIARAALFFRANWPLGVPVTVFGLMLWQWYRRGRDPRRRPIAPRYGPPDGLTPAEVGTLVDHRADVRDITATLVDLAVRGFIVIEEEKRDGLLWSSRDWTLRRAKPPSPDLRPHERALYDALFADGGDTVALATLENRFYRELRGIRDRIFAALVGRGYYTRRPDEVRHLYWILAGAVACVGVVAAIPAAPLLARLSDAAPVTVAVAALLSAAVIAAFGAIMPARTVAGARTLEDVLGFEEFLARVEGPRLERVVKTPAMFERFLPFAMALGVERSWARAFADICRTSPDWYRGGDPTSFRADRFVDRMGGMSQRAAAVMVSQPRSAGGSGFGGGGSSGGGFGGGGGGGF